MKSQNERAYDELFSRYSTKQEKKRERRWNKSAPRVVGVLPGDAIDRTPLPDDIKEECHYRAFNRDALTEFQARDFVRNSCDSGCRMLMGHTTGKCKAMMHGVGCNAVVRHKTGINFNRGDE